MTFISIFLGLSAITALFGIIIYNRLVALRQTRNNAFSDIDVQLKLRHDLIPNLVETVKRYLTHEQETLQNVTAARASAMQASSIRDKSAAESMLDGSLMKLMMVTENYPELKADNSFQRFHNEMTSIERSIASARRFFNNSTAELNTAVQQFPANLIAKPTGFTIEDYFELQEDKRAELDEPLKIAFN